MSKFIPTEVEIMDFLAGLNSRQKQIITFLRDEAEMEGVENMLASLVIEGPEGDKWSIVGRLE